MISTDISIWIGSILILLILSALFKTSKYYRVAEAIFVGAGVGNMVVMSVKNVKDLGIASIMRGEVIYIFTMILGLLIFTRLAPQKKMRWPSVYPVTFLTGIGMGLSISSVLFAQVITPVMASTLHILGGTSQSMVNNLIIFVLTITVLQYFVFTIEHKGTIRYLAKIGRYGMMVAFGQALGGKVIGFGTAYLGALQFVLFDLLGLA